MCLPMISKKQDSHTYCPRTFSKIRNHFGSSDSGLCYLLTIDYEKFMYRISSKEHLGALFKIELYAAAIIRGRCSLQNVESNFYTYFLFPNKRNKDCVKKVLKLKNYGSFMDSSLGYNSAQLRKRLITFVPIGSAPFLQSVSLARANALNTAATQKAQFRLMFVNKRLQH